MMCPSIDAASDAPVVIIGGGPAGLTAGYALSSAGRPVIIFEQHSVVGGLARTVEHQGFRFDIGGHRFFSKSAVVQDLWRKVLGPDLLVRPRLSRIYYRQRFFRYPLRPLDVVWNLGVWSSLRVLASYAAARLHPIPDERSFADWVINRFGRRLYLTFFKTYTEKVWGIPCERISADWAAQRVLGLTLRSALVGMFKRHRGAGAIKTLIDQFEYPRLGPGMMWERFAQIIERQGGRIELDTRVERLLHDGARITEVEVSSGGSIRRVSASHVISTTSIPRLISGLMPKIPAAADAAAGLKHRGFLTVALMIDRAELFRDNWIYVHDSSVRVGRIQNFKNWSPEMVPDPRWTCLGLEYFCDVGDDLWTMHDDALVALARRELAQLRLADPAWVRDGVVVRMEDAYPVYDEGYQTRIEIVRRALAPLRNLQLVGRNGMHRYNNQDHSMLTALLAVANLSGGRHDLWRVNADDEYLEQGASLDAGVSEGELQAIAGAQPLVPTPLRARES